MKPTALSPVMVHKNNDKIDEGRGGNRDSELPELRTELASSGVLGGSSSQGGLLHDWWARPQCNVDIRTRR